MNYVHGTQGIGRRSYSLGGAGLKLEVGISGKRASNNVLNINMGTDNGEIQPQIIDTERVVNYKIVIPRI